MNQLKRLNDAMRYIEENLFGDLDFDEIFKIAACSEYSFRRVFSFLAGMPLGEYVRRRRLAEAAQKIRDGREKTINLSLACGYETPESFAKAFHAMHGASPSEAKKSAAPVKAFPPMTFQLTIKGGIEMDYRIVEKEAFFIAGIKKRIPLIYEGINPHMDSMWASLTAEDFLELKSLSDIEPGGILCVSVNFSEGRFLSEGDELDQYIGVATAKPPQNRWEILPVSAGLWAVFTAVGEFPKTLQNVWGRIFSEWFPSSGFEPTGGPEILWNESPDTAKPNYRSEIWIPVAPRG